MFAYAAQYAVGSRQHSKHIVVVVGSTFMGASCLCENALPNPILTTTLLAFLHTSHSFSLYPLPTWQHRTWLQMCVTFFGYIENKEDVMSTNCSILFLVISRLGILRKQFWGMRKHLRHGGLERCDNALDGVNNVHLCDLGLKHLIFLIKQNTH